MLMSPRVAYRAGHGRGSLQHVGAEVPQAGRRDLAARDRDRRAQAARVRRPERRRGARRRGARQRARPAAGDRDHGHHLARLRRRVATIYVTGHRNPDTDSIASAIGYAELKRRLDPRNEYVPVRLGELNEQTRWVLERSGVPEPRLLPHVLLRVRDVMRDQFPLAGHGEPVRQVGLIMARDEVDLVPVVDDDGALAGVMSERSLARRYVRESREASRLDAPTAVGAIAGVLEGEQLVGEPDACVSGRVWVLAMASESLPLGFAAGDVVVVGNRPKAQRVAIEVGVGLLVITNDTEPEEEILRLARERGTAVVVSPLDSYVTARMVTLSAPCRSLMDREPLVVGREDLITDITENVKDVDYRSEEHTSELQS